MFHALIVNKKLILLTSIKYICRHMDRAHVGVDRYAREVLIALELQPAVACPVTSVTDWPVMSREVLLSVRNIWVVIIFADDIDLFSIEVVEASLGEILFQLEAQLLVKLVVESKVLGKFHDALME